MMLKHYLPERHPIYWLEFRRQWRNLALRSRLSIIGAGALTVILSADAIVLAIYFFILTQGSDWLIGSRPDIEGLWRAVKIIEMLLLPTIATLFMMSSISRERERRTLDALVIVFTPTEIILEKALGYLTVPLLIYAMCIVLFSLLALVCRGVTCGQMLVDHLLVLIMLLGGGAIGLIATTRSRGIAGSMVWGMVGVAGMYYCTILLLPTLQWLSYVDERDLLHVALYVVVLLCLCAVAPLSGIDALRRLRTGELGMRHPRPAATTPAWLPRRYDLLPIRGCLLWFELRRRMRGDSGFLILFCYLAALGIVLVLATGDQPTTVNALWMPDIGRTLWGVLSVTQFIIVILLAPGLAVNSLMIEREHGTLESLFMSPLTNRAIVWGKLFGTLGQLLLLLFASLPIFATIAMTYGGISPLEVFFMFAAQTLVGAFLGSIGLLAACIARQYTAAVVRAYLTAFVGLSPFLCLPIFGGITVAAFIGLGGMAVMIAPITNAVCNNLKRLRGSCSHEDEEAFREEEYRRQMAAAHLAYWENRHQSTDTDGWSMPNMSGRE